MAVGRGVRDVRAAGHLAQREPFRPGFLNQANRSVDEGLSQVAMMVWFRRHRASILAMDVDGVNIKP
jgi:hypothetical protein